MVVETFVHCFDDTFLTRKFQETSEKIDNFFLILENIASRRKERLP